jgi:DNA-3-methyladenine glycosylase
MTRSSPDPLPRSFYARPVLTVARDCIGKVLMRRTREGLVAGRIVEAEAYRGPEDRAAHSFGGRRTARTEVMYGPAGHVYVFFVYGIHHQFNVVTSRVGLPHAVLIRAVEPTLGVDLMARRRGLAAEDRNLTNGPGRLCRAFAITLADSGTDLCGRELFLSDADPVKVARSKRIGIDYAGPWAAKLWRFVDPSSRHLSHPRRATAHR